MATCTGFSTAFLGIRIGFGSSLARIRAFRWHARCSYPPPLDSHHCRKQLIGRNRPERIVLKTHVLLPLLSLALLASCNPNPGALTYQNGSETVPGMISSGSGTVTGPTSNSGNSAELDDE